MTARVLWYHRGTKPMAAIYPDDIDGTNPLRELSSVANLAPVHWEHSGSKPARATYPDDATAQAFTFTDPDARTARVLWFHAGKGALTVTYPDALGEGGGGEEPGPYATAAVNFDGQALLSTASLVSTDNEYAALSFWVKVPLSGPGGGYALVGDPNGTFYPYFNIVNGGQGFGINIADAAGASFIDASEGMALAGLAEWHHVLLAFQTNLAAGNKILKGYVDDVIVFSAPGNDPSDAFDISTNGKEFVFGGYGDPMDGITGDFADVWFAPGANLLTDGDISEATRRKFISAEGKPVNLGADGSTPTGTAPAMFFRRAPAAAASTFGNNLGTGGAFTITGTLTNASTSPSD